MARLPATRRFDMHEYHQMAAAGILHEDDRVELIEGEIVEMSPIGSRHTACAGRAMRLLDRNVGDAGIARVRSSVRLSRRSEPQPDLTLLKLRADF